MSDYQLSGGFDILGDFTLCPRVDLQQYFGEWLIEERSFFHHLHAYQNMDLTGHFRATAEQPTTRMQVGGGKRFNVIRDNIAHIELTGPMTKRTQSAGPVGTMELRRQIRLAGNDDDIAGVFLKIDSPGGTVAGTPDFADDVFQVAQNKPVMAYIEDLGASAAYYVASQATLVRANASAKVGSIGTMTVVLDMSERAKQEGVTVHVIKTGDFKAVGVPGAKVTGEQLEDLQQLVNRVNDMFLQAIDRGRSGMSMADIRKVADGRLHLAAQAAELGLIDGVSTVDAALDELVSLTTSSTRVVTMSETTAAPQAATIAELRAAFPTASDGFLLSQIEKQATITEASTAFIAVQTAELEQAKAEAKEAKEAQEAAKAAQAEAEQLAANALPGNNDTPADDVEAVASSWSDPDEKWENEIAACYQQFLEEMIDRKVSQGMEKSAARMHSLQEAKIKAVTHVDKSYPGLREQMLVARSTKKTANPEVDPALATS